MATDWDLIKVETEKIRKKYDIDLDYTVIILEVLKQFNGSERTFFSDIDTKKIREFLFAKEKEKMNAKLFEITGRNFNDRNTKVSKVVQESPEWQHTMHGYFST